MTQMEQGMAKPGRGIKKSELFVDRYFGFAAENRVRKLGEILSKSQADRLLDIGCADGSLTEFVAKTLGAKEIRAVEIYEKTAELARARGIDVVVMDIDEAALPFADDYFDAVFSGGVIDHIFDTDHYLDEIWRVLKPGGWCVLTAPNLASWFDRLSILLGFQPIAATPSVRYRNVGRMPFINVDGYGDRHRPFTLRALRKLIELHGFKIMKVWGVHRATDGSQMPAFLVLPFRIVNAFTKHFPSLAHTLMVKAEKPLQIDGAS